MTERGANTTPVAAWVPRSLLACLVILFIPESHARSLGNATVNFAPDTTFDSNTIETSLAVPPALALRNSRSLVPNDVLNGIEDGQIVPLAQEIVCHSVDIKNQVSSFDFLRNCTVIEGSLTIGPIDFPEKPYENHSYPNLREVTGRMLVYRVTGLRSLKNIFPNLAIIRGQKLFRNHALAIFENKDLEEIGLVGLVKIVRGSVFIWRNNLLCYVTTINWRSLTDKDFWEHNSIRENKQEDQCGNTCPADKCETFFFDKRSRNMCWTAQDCQKSPLPICDSSPPQSRNQRRGSCCNHFCLAGCFGALRNECQICQKVHYNGACYEYCPANSYMLMGRRCVPMEYCRSYSSRDAWKAYMITSVNAKGNKMESGECSAQCPTHFMPDPVDPHKCIPCTGPCPEVCSDNYTVDTLASVERLRGCTTINGTLEIRVGRGDQIARALETALEKIEEVTGYVKIIRSHALLSLGFFRKLRVIKGETLSSGFYAFHVMDNQNLQELFPYTAERPKLIISNPNAKIGFHFNPHLCRSKIDTFVRGINASKGINDYDDLDIAKTSNGDRAACDMEALRLWVNALGSHFVILEWDALVLPDHRSLLGYVIRYRESPGRNLTIFDGRDACGDSAWSQIDATAGETQHALYDLRPARQYGAYVTTYTVTSENKGGQSEIIYFTTRSAQPTKPVGVRTESLNSSAISVHWKTPVDPNGAITHYYVRWQKLTTDRHRQLGTRNYCRDPILMPKHFEDQKTTTAAPPAGCPCNGTDATGKAIAPQNIVVDQAEMEEAIYMENVIQDIVFTKRRQKRAALVDETSADSNTLFPTSFIDITTSPAWNSTTTTASPVGNATNVTVAYQEGNDTTTSPRKVVSTTPAPPAEPIHEIKIEDGTSFVIRNLHHFTDYIITVQACQDSALADSHAPCSDNATASTTQTLAKRGSDNIPSDSVSVSFLDQETDGPVGPIVLLTWSDPKTPNGAVVTVDVEYRNLDHAKAHETTCVPRTINASRLPEHRMDFSDVVKMPSGNYSFRLRASSFAGEGLWTEPRYLYVKQPTTPHGLIFQPSQLAGIILGVIVPCLLLFAAYLWRYKPWQKKVPPEPVVVSVNPDYYSYTPDEWEVPREKIQLIKEIGNGAFGKVYLGIGTNLIPGKEVSQVAVKTVNDDRSESERSFFLREASVMKAFHTFHVVKLIGVVSEGQPAMVLMELMEKGDLKSYLREQRPDEAHPERNKTPQYSIYQMAGEICDGMAYIHSRKFVHRDLAARNCMINERLTVKIGDFGMTRDVYETDYYRKGGKGLLPVRWMAPESLRDGLFTNSSDVWSFGVVLWEIITLAEQPYRGLSHEQVLNFVINGQRNDPVTGELVMGYMEMPEGCAPELYEIMVNCWQYNNKSRPTFMQIIDRIKDRITESFHENSYFSTVDQTDPSLTVAGEDPVDGQEMQDIGTKVFSLAIAMPGASDDDDEESRETDQLLDEAAGDGPMTTHYVTTKPLGQSPNPPPYPLEIQTDVIQQNGGSTVSSADNSRSMVLSFPKLDASSLPHAQSNGSVGGNANGIPDKQSRF